MGCNWNNKSVLYRTAQYLLWILHFARTQKVYLERTESKPGRERPMTDKMLSYDVCCCAVRCWPSLVYSKYWIFLVNQTDSLSSSCQNMDSSTLLPERNSRKFLNNNYIFLSLEAGNPREMPKEIVSRVASSFSVNKVSLCLYKGFWLLFVCFLCGGRDKLSVVALPIRTLILLD